MRYFTVFTPTYNRAYILENAYRSLLRQTYKDFKWVIMDDGSTDNTESLVESWIQENKIDILYKKQNNLGRFVAHNNAIELFEGNIIVNLDSDDKLKENCLQEIHDLWEKRSDITKENIVGIICYMQYPDGKIIGNEFPDLVAERCYVLRDKYRLSGDKLQVYSVDLIRENPYPVFAGEKFIGDSIIMNKINETGKLLILKKPLYIRDYPDDSLTKNIDKIHYNSPRGMAFYYKETTKYYKKNIIKRLTYAAKYIAFSKIANEKIDLSSSKLIYILMYYPGILYAKMLKKRVDS